MKLNIQIEGERVSFNWIKIKVEQFIVKLKEEMGDNYVEVIRQ